MRYKLDLDLAEYLDVFIDYGYDKLQIIKEINDDEQLIDIGIENENHRRVILNGIREMKCDHENNFKMKKNSIYFVATINKEMDCLENHEI